MYTHQHTVSSSHPYFYYNERQEFVWSFKWCELSMFVIAQVCVLLCCMLDDSNFTYAVEQIEHEQATRFLMGNKNVITDYKLHLC